ncbi:cytochrome b/b6 domain-containing protein [Vibrio sp. Isolate25]|uniref:cytochrome b n=1 Tax=Vibrio TaxID=662 RepID=UPI001EFCA72D|nr:MULTISPECIES: cytochrome b/b6 domain-containing protein [Vibrio]MCG9595395.1 cytochrome b/b6 domain-containing protein [Vibrio sp. Isolate25]MCG9676884.1 cytochrome b/b6 domain-containing protein [Vibrio sp. Isolate24]USD34446.1 cytochrome b/b6 domain-containing protein [Vibrio sp. SCSIO 43186]USD47518.1 cytochrome b/b6 domain-containing protein [Vibrio sp. SCSIO 43145]USD71571.1 cytochrome b/b6 domain-containing protein [Vibrio sp. SCSIO 43139]
MNISDFSYDRASKVFHWLMAIIILYTTIAGYGMHFTTVGSPTFNFLSTLNMSLATIAVPVFLARWVWKYFRPSFNDELNTSSFQKNMAKLIHSLMYFTMFGVFTSGFLMLEHPYYFFWVIEINHFITEPEVSSFFFKVHRFSCLILASLVTLHILAVIHHHVIRKNKILKLMI